MTKGVGRTNEGLGVEELDRSNVVARWLRALDENCDVALPALWFRDVVARLVDTFFAALEADPFDADTGMQIGRELVRQGLTDPVVPAVSAQVLYRLANLSRHSDTQWRMAALLATMGQGYQAALAERPVSGGADGADQQVRQILDERIQIAFDSSAVAAAIGDTDGNMLVANQHLADMLGVPVEQLRNISVHHFAHPDDVDEINSLIYDKLVPARSGTVRLERRMIRADGTTGWAMFSISYVQGAAGQPDYLVAIGEDVTERHRNQRELHWQARHDLLTGLPNRRNLLEQIAAISSSCHRGDRIGLCFADLDGFKAVNDRFGHAIGDQVLIAAATRMSGLLSGDDCVIARLGGDEFVVLICPPTDGRKVAAVADSLLSALSVPFLIGEHRIQVSTSVGIVVSLATDVDAEELLHAADRQLYRAKNSGKDRWVLHTIDPAP